VQNQSEVLFDTMHTDTIIKHGNTGWPIKVNHCHESSLNRIKPHR